MRRPPFWSSIVLACLIVASSATAATIAWTGAVSNQWSVGGNWNSGVVPVAGDALVFPAGTTNRNMNNDLPTGLALQSLSFPSGTTMYSLSGNGLSLSAGLSTLCCATFTAPMTLTASQTFSSGGNDNFAGPIDLNGFTLTMVPYVTTLSGSLNGSGSFVLSGGGGLNLTGSSTFSGTFSLIGARMNVSGSIANSSLTVNNSAISGNGTIPATSLLDGATMRVGNEPGAGCCADPHTTGILSTGNVSLQGGALQLDLGNPTPGTGHDQINTTGSVTLTNPTLLVSLPSLIPTASQTFVIINNDGTDAIAGTFAGLPEGATFTVGSSQFRISYVGGSGNDVVLTALAATASNLTSSMNPTVSGQSFILNAHVTSSSGTPQGTVVFRDGAIVLGTVAVDANGDAFLNASLRAGNHSIIATFQGTGIFAPSTSNTLTQNVAKGNAAVTLATTPNPSIDNQAIDVSVQVSASAPATGVPTGSVTINVDGQPVGTVMLDGTGAASLFIGPLAAGDHVIAASYAGDSEFTSAQSAPATQSVLARIKVRDATVFEPSVDSTVSVVVELVAASSQPVTVSYSTSDSTAVAGLDYIAASGTIDFAPGVTSRSMQIIIKSDSIVEPQETFRIVLTSPSNAVLDRPEAVVTITDPSAIPTLDEYLLLLLAAVLALVARRAIH